MNPSGFDQQAAQRLQTAWNAGKRKTPDMSREYPVGLWAAAEKHAKQEKTWQAVGDGIAEPDSGVRHRAE